MAERINDAIFNFVYELAMRDAVMRTAFRGESIYALLGKPNPNTGKPATDDQIANAENAKSAVKAYALGIFTEQGFESQDQHDNTWLTATESVIDAFKDYRENKSEFTFGNAQKLLNMVAKYLFMTTYAEPNLRKRKFQYCHCPMDSIMLDVVAKKAADGSGEASKEFSEKYCKSVRHRDGSVERMVRDNLKWSRLSLNDPRYDCFQKTVRELAEPYSPIEFDFIEWSSR